eukprot:g24236.t2
MAEVEEPPAKRARNGENGGEADESNITMEDIFGEGINQSGLEKVLAEQMDDDSDNDKQSVQSFLVDDQFGQVDDAQFGLTPSKLDWVTNVFGDTSVLRPLGELEGGDEDAPPAVHASLGAAEAAAAASLAAKQESTEADATAVEAVLPLCDALDPDVLEKSYQLPVDQAFANSQEPERWLQTYCQGQANSVRSWTDEEYQTEARWIYNQAFRSRGYERQITETAIVRVLSKLHDKKLELVYIVEHVWWMVAKALTKEDLWTIQEYDFLWQPLWKRYLLLLEWTQKLEQAGTSVPDHIKQRVQRDVWNHPDAEQFQRDAQDWLKAMHPSTTPSGESLRSTTSSVDAVMKMARRSKFDEKLGIKESIDRWARCFSVQVDPQYPGTALERLQGIHFRVKTLSTEELSGEWQEVRRRLLWAGGLRDLPDVPPGRGCTAHSFNDDTHCDLTAMLGDVAHNQNDGNIQGIATGNLLGPGIQVASLPELGPGGSWSTCMNGCHLEPPQDVAHVQFRSRVAFKLVWCPPAFKKFVLVDDDGNYLAHGEPSGELPHEIWRSSDRLFETGQRWEWTGIKIHSDKPRQDPDLA